jgi:hypothetical protein
MPVQCTLVTALLINKYSYIAYLLITLRVYIHVEDFGRGTRPCGLRIRSLTRKTGALRTPSPHPLVAASVFISSSHVTVKKIPRQDKAQFLKNPLHYYNFSQFKNTTLGGTVKSKCFLD